MKRSAQKLSTRERPTVHEEVAKTILTPSEWNTLTVGKLAQESAAPRGRNEEVVFCAIHPGSKLSCDKLVVANIHASASAHGNKGCPSHRRIHPRQLCRKRRRHLFKGQRERTQDKPLKPRKAFATKRNNQNKPTLVVTVGSKNLSFNIGDPERCPCAL